MRTLTHTALCFVGAVVACQAKPERSWCGDGECTRSEDPESCPSDCLSENDDQDHRDDAGPGGDTSSLDNQDGEDDELDCPRAYEGKVLTNPTNKCEARAACNFIGSCGNGDWCIESSSGEREGLISPTAVQACDSFTELNAMVPPVSGELVLQIVEGKVGFLAIQTRRDDCRPDKGFSCDASAIAAVPVTAGTVVFWWLAGGDASEYQIGVGGGEAVPYTLRWEINGEDR